jgi:hypothetical protein
VTVERWVPHPSAFCALGWDYTNAYPAVLKGVFFPLRVDSCSQLRLVQRLPRPKPGKNSLPNRREQHNVDKQTRGVTEIRFVLPVPDSKRDNIVRFQFDLTQIGRRGA